MTATARPTDVSDLRETVNSFLRLLAAGDADGVAALFSEQIDWYVPGDSRLPWTGPRTRREEVSAYFRTMWPVFVEGASESRIDEILVDGHEAALFGRFTHTVKSTGRSFTTPVAFRLTVRDGRIERLHLFEDTLAVARAMPLAAG
ncbi:nuclear transport factor 2 family protein [Streptomyces sp. NBC_01471]|uniref:nuclear transport factor 2 family protein n=1 Tax=Streptomyces sp. NBC_01471 TaxID=2903879 RepID=UPI00324F28B6